ncbi:glycoside hydrolase family 2 [Puteibacter caeruleilacunae]|nr:glycoside hydrolase family 2 [Puteibacter caeruleilacunae]
MTRINLLLCLCFLITNIYAQQTQKQYLSGTGHDNRVDWEFFCSEGQNSGKWTTIPVPSCWETEGFGNYNYGSDKNPHKEYGQYKYQFNVPKGWKSQSIEIVFEGSMTDTEVKINGKLAGPIHQGAFYRFRYNISKLLKYGSNNLLEVKVNKVSANKSVNQAEREADFWIFGGIFRPVYLEAKPQTHIQWTAIDARADGSFMANIHHNNSKKTLTLEAQVMDLSGKKLGKPFTATVEKGSAMTSVSGHTANPQLWSPEFPNRYKVQFTLKNNDDIVHQTTEKFGYRTVEVRPHDGIYVNDQKVVFKGVNRHSSYPSSAKTMSRSLSIMDVKLMKEMNMNAVRMSHYPPDDHFLEVCDSLGLFVLDELAGWQAWYDTTVGKKLVKEMLMKDVNHPCIVLWDNGNEKGWNTELDSVFAKYDPQNRQVVHPMALLNGMDTQHYKPFDHGANSFGNSRDIYFPTEFLHGLYDGGHGAGLEDYWNEIVRHQNGAGGFLWVFADEGVVRTDQNNKVDCHLNYAPDGIVGPYREKEGSFYTIRELWSPVQFKIEYLTPDFNGKIKVENNFIYTNLNQCKLIQELVSLPKSGSSSVKANAIDSVEIPFGDIKPGETSHIQLDVKNLAKYDALRLKVIDPHGNNIITKSLSIQPTDSYLNAQITSSNDKVTVAEESKQLTFKVKDMTYSFDKSSGNLSKVTKSGKTIPFNGGPATGNQLKVKNIRHQQIEEGYEVVYTFEDIYREVKWTIHNNGRLELNYLMKLKNGRYDLIGINFNYPEDEVKKARWMGDGPYRVWKNRMKGPQFGLWEKAYNNTITGIDWQYPEFKGYHSNICWTTIYGENNQVTIYTGIDNTFLRLYTPEFPENARKAHAPFPEGDISFMHGIPAIGTKFQPAENLGSQGMKNVIDTWYPHQKPVKGRLLFDFNID